MVGEVDKKVTSELVRLVSIFEAEALIASTNDPFVRDCVENVLGVWVLGAPLGADAWSAIRLIMLSILHDLEDLEGNRIDPDFVLILREDVGSAELRWFTIEEARQYHQAVLKLPLPVDPFDDEGVANALSKVFFAPFEVLGSLKYDI